MKSKLTLILMIFLGSFIFNACAEEEITPQEISGEGNVKDDKEF
ncbi:MAG: hypothetical protein AAF901_12265 [Bacteroidota bacterium]